MSSRPEPFLVGYRKVYSVRCEADVVMTSVASGLPVIQAKHGGGNYVSWKVFQFRRLRAIVENPGRRAHDTYGKEVDLRRILKSGGVRS